MRFIEPSKETIDAICRNTDARTTLELSRLEIWMHAGIDGRAMAYLGHFLNGSGETVHFPLADLLREAPRVLERVIEDDLHGIRARWRNGDYNDKLLIHKEDYCEFTQAQKDWYYALGEIFVSWEKKSALSFFGHQHNQCKEKSTNIRFHLNVANPYDWDPDKRKGMKTECIHKAGQLLDRTGQASNFMMLGECDIEFNPAAAPFSFVPQPIRIWDICSMP